MLGKSRVLSCTLGLALSAASIAAPPRVFPVAEKPVPGDAYPDRVTRFAGGVTGLADITYSSIPGYRPMVVDIYLPPKAAVPTAKPLIMYIHGGGWMAGHTRQAGALADFPSVLAKLASEGFVVASLEYRLAGEARFPAQLQDVRAAVRYLKANAGKYGIDPGRVALWGGSAGGHLAALAALSCGAPGIDDKPQPAGTECVQGAVIWYGVFDFAPLMARAEGAPVGLLGCASAEVCPAEKVAAVSPLTYLDAKDPPFLLIHGEADKTVSVQQSLTAYDRMKAVGVPVEKIIFPGVDHSFIGTTPKSTRDATLTAVNATFDFFHRLFDRK